MEVLLMAVLMDGGSEEFYGEIIKAKHEHAPQAK